MEPRPVACIIKRVPRRLRQGALVGKGSSLNDLLLAIVWIESFIIFSFAIHFHLARLSATLFHADWLPMTGARLTSGLEH